MRLRQLRQLGGAQHPQSATTGRGAFPTEVSAEARTGSTTCPPGHPAGRAMQPGKCSRTTTPWGTRATLSWCPNPPCPTVCPLLALRFFLANG